MTTGESSIEGVGGIKLADISQSSHDDFVRQKEISQAFDGAIQKAVTFPSNVTNPAERPNTFLVNNGQNSFVAQRGSSETHLGDARSSADVQIEQVMGRFRSLYVEMTNFSVAWSVAKRTGRDIETLLRAQ
ncbi:hypothetical protein [uncultured Tateyamaria sp.]|uniref:hypothetical protein n=1 Tax=uncultured Tateyamaria sp. TaxID=455651 RepID=UPI00261FFBA2|nr:hypothetical protein [uncultured Tateyamaria sp.]